MKTICCVMLLSALVGLAMDAFGEKKSKIISTFRIDDPLSVLRLTDYSALQKVADDFTEISSFRKIMLVDRWSELLHDQSNNPLRGYKWNGKGPNLERTSGRLSWLMDKICEELSVGENENLDVKIKKWKDKLKAEQRTLSKADMEEIKNRYRGKIYVGIVGQQATESIGLLDSLFEEWFPYGKSIAELEALTGLDLNEDKGKVLIRIDSGYGGYEYELGVQEGIIKAVQKNSIN